ncbi:MAG: polysaccharide deacetylase family protein [Micavibrio aeruginosavorus]|uniref:Polysaccharide deacetylase family protein n=1 Tax=Micavibrio aeruginosavorus TaxID=349221 RepID=A0A2W5MUI4_9BACT|nr:MAG: polysaccharide deacetylase family protein [Micavibrio aeruginosavorus]
MRSAYLTIDDSASERTDDLVDYLVKKGIPAVFFCWGENLEKNPAAMVRAVQKGFVLANHTNTHQRASNNDAAFTIDEIKQCEFLIDRIYKEAGVKKSHKYFRYPHVDRGTGAWVIDYDQADPHTRQAVMEEIADGVNLPDKSKPATSAFEKKQQLQDYLKGAGYTNPFTKVTHDWFWSGEMGQAVDSLFTYSNADWMMLPHQLGKWPYKTVQDLKQKARNNRWLNEENSVSLVLAHDKTLIVDVTIELIDDMLETGLKFLEI